MIFKLFSLQIMDFVYSLTNFIIFSQMLDLLKKQKTSDSEEDDASLDKFASLSRNLSKPQMMTSSVSIAPVKQEPKMTEIKHEAEDEELTAPVDDDDDDDQPKNKGSMLYSHFLRVINFSLFNIFCCPFQIS